MEARAAIIIPTFNRPNLLARAVRSAINQTSPAAEILVVNDCLTTPISARISKEFGDRVRVLRTLGLTGPSKARNTALQLLSPQTNAVCYLDDDDELLPNHIELLSRPLEQGASFAFSKALYKYPNGDETTDPEPRNPGPKRYYDPLALLEQNIAPVSSFMHTVEAGKAIGGWDDTLVRMEDWDFWGRMFIAFGPPVPLPNVTNVIHKDSGANRTDYNRFIWTMACSWRDVVASRLKFLASERRALLCPKDLAMFHVPRVGIIMPVYNAARFLRQAIESILSQTFQDFEFIVVNDGSNDESKAIVESYLQQGNGNIRVFDMPKQSGVTKTLNFALLVSRSELIARMDADDVSLPDRIAEQVAFLDGNKDISILGTWFHSMDEDLKSIVWDNQTPTDPDAISKELLNRCCIGHPTIMMRKKTVEVLGGYDESSDVLAVEDYEFWLRATSRGFRIANLPKHLYKHRIHGGQITRVLSNEQKRNFESVRQKYRKMHGVKP